MIEIEKVLTHLDIPYSYELAKRMEAYRCNPELGYRSAGSKAEFLTGEMLELIHSGVKNIICTQPFGCLPNHIVGKGVIKELRKNYPESNIIAVDYDPGASEVNQMNRIKLMLATAQKNLKAENA